MPDRSPALAAAVRAVRGESDLDVVMPALADERLARGIACAPGTHPLVRAVAALCGGLTGLLDAPTIAEPTLHGAMARLIGTPAGRAALRAWAEVAPAGWGAAHGAALIAAIIDTMVEDCVAAALIGPNDTVAGLLHAAGDVAFAIRCWGRFAPASPTAWAEALSAAERKRLTDTALRAPAAVACCLPWLPPDVVNQTRIDPSNVGAAINAFAAASPTARAQHAAVLRRLVAGAQPAHLDALTRLACAMPTDEVWTRVQTLIRASPNDAWRVVVAASWDDVQDDVRRVILRRADTSGVCAAVAAARGKRTSDSISWKTAAAFFAALDPAVWDAMDAATQQRWGQAALAEHLRLAVRSLGLRPEILARAHLGNDLVHAARRHAPDDAALRAALLPVTLRDLSPDDAHDLIAALPTMPPDPGAFFCIAGLHGDPAIIAPARSALRTPADLALAVAIGRRGAHDRSWRDALLALLAAPPRVADAVWQALGNDMRQAIGAVVAAAPPDADPLAVHDPIAALALAAMRSSDADLRNAGSAAFAARCARIRAIWDDLPLAVRQDLAELPAFADLMQTPTRSAIRRDLRRRRA